MKAIILPITILLVVCLNACSLIEIDDISEARSGTVYFWIASDADTYVECLTIGGGCAGGDANHSGRDALVVAHNASVIKRSYINFPKPSFPPGTQIEEAYFELYHSGQNEDGKTDNINIEVTRVVTPWNASTITFDNQPVPVGPYSEFNLRLKSLAWSGTDNIAWAMRESLQSGNAFEGFVAYISSFEPGYEKGFYSNNHSSRTSTELGQSPRLLLKVKLPDGYTTDDVTFGPTHPDANGMRTFGYRFKSGNNWPADWDVAISN